MFYLIGIGLKPQHLTLEAVEALKECEIVYLETYTCVYAEGSIEELEKMTGRKVIQLGRPEVEEGFVENLKVAKERNVALLVFGNALTATTHTQILIDAKKHGVPFSVIAGVSVTDFLGKTSLNIYKFGRSVTLVLPQENYAPESFYEQIVENRERGLHTLCFLDIQQDKGRMMSVKEAVTVLEKIDGKYGNKLLKDSVLVAISKAGAKDEKIIQGSAKQVRDAKLDVPAFLVVCGALSDFEKEALDKLHGKSTLGDIARKWF